MQARQKPPQQKICQQIEKRANTNETNTSKKLQKDLNQEHWKIEGIGDKVVTKINGVL